VGGGKKKGTTGRRPFVKPGGRGKGGTGVGFPCCLPEHGKRAGKEKKKRETVLTAGLTKGKRTPRPTNRPFPEGEKGKKKKKNLPNPRHLFSPGRKINPVTALFADRFQRREKGKRGKKGRPGRPTRSAGECSGDGKGDHTARFSNRCFPAQRRRKKKGQRLYPVVSEPNPPYSPGPQRTASLIPAEPGKKGEKEEKTEPAVW